jgi:hypothetical protein
MTADPGRPGIDWPEVEPDATADAESERIMAEASAEMVGTSAGRRAHPDPGQRHPGAAHTCSRFIEETFTEQGAMPRSMLRTGRAPIRVPSAP